MNTDVEKNYYQFALRYGEDETFPIGSKEEKMIDYITSCNPRTLLEVGCGEANLISKLPSSISYTGIDPSDYAIDKGKRHFADIRNVSLWVGYAHNLPYDDASFDAVVSHFSLEHFAHPRESLVEMARVLAPGGIIIIIAPNLEFPFSYPSALRHKPKIYRIYFTLLHMMDYLLRFFGIYRFRTIQENYLDATGRYEHGDDDLRYIVSSDEVIGFLKQHGFVLIEADTINEGKKAFLTHLPGLRYYGTELFVILEKRLCVA